MRRRAIASAVPLVAILCLAVLFRSSSALVHALAVSGFAYASIIVLVLVRRRWPPESRPLSRGIQLQTAPVGKALTGSLESAITMSRSTLLEYQKHLRPVLYRITTARLALRGISVEEEPEKAEALLGTRVWQLVCPCEDPSDREGSGMTLEAIEEIVSRIEEV